MLKDSGRDLRCEVYGCGNTTNYRIGKEGMPSIGDIVMCKDCMLELFKDLVEKMPEEYVHKLYEFVAVVINPEKSIPVEEKIETVPKSQELKKLSALTRPELVAYAKELNVPGKLVTFSKEQLLIEILKAEGR